MKRLLFVSALLFVLSMSSFAQTKDYRAGIITVERWIETLRGAPILNSGYYRQTYSGNLADAFSVNYTGSGSNLLNLQADGVSVLTLAKSGTVTASGSFDINGGIALGDATLGSYPMIRSDFTNTSTSGFGYGGEHFFRVNPTSDSSATFFGDWRNVIVPQTNTTNFTGTYTTIWGNYYQVQFQGSGSLPYLQGTTGLVENTYGAIISEARGLYGRSYNKGSGTITNSIGVYGQIANAGTATTSDGYCFRSQISNTAGTITNGYGFYFKDPTASGTITNLYGLYLESPTKGGTNYSIYSAGGTSYFGGNVTTNGYVDWAAGNVIFVPLTGDIQTYVNNAVAGDTLILASGKYTITSPIVIAKQLNIMGQGNAGFATAIVTPSHGTLISSSSATLANGAFQITSDNVRLAHFSIDLTGNASTGVCIGTVGPPIKTNLVGIVLTNIDVIVNCAGWAQGFTVYGSDVVMRNLSFYITSTNTVASGVWIWNNSDVTIDSVVDCFNVTGTTKAAATFAFAFVCENDDSNLLTLNLSNSVCKALAGTVKDVAVASISTTPATNSSIVNAYMSTLDGEDYDAWQEQTNQLNLGGSVLANNRIYGTPTYRAAMVSGIVQSPQINGGILANEDIAMQGTTHGTRTTSYVVLQPNGGNVGVTDATPASLFTVGDGDRFQVDSNGSVIYNPSVAQVIDAVGDAILANASMVVLDPDGNYTLTSAPTIASGTTGQILYITSGNGEANTVTVQDQDTLPASNLQLGATTRVIGAKDVLVLLFDGTDWLEISYANN